MSTPTLPANFSWGFATAAYQIEGAVDEDGRGPCIWDKFCHLEPSRTKNANADVACDHYHRWQEDFDLLSQYKAKAYRFSLSWSRIIPLGGREDPVNEAGLAFYDKQIDDLLARGIEPWITLYHWDLPQALDDRYGGWLNVDESSADFEHFSRVCFARFGDRVKHWITLNEPWIQTIFVRDRRTTVKYTANGYRDTLRAAMLLGAAASTRSRPRVTAPASRGLLAKRRSWPTAVLWLPTTTSARSREDRLACR